jgi:hypothetical protein
MDRSRADFEALGGVARDQDPPELGQWHLDWNRKSRLPRTELPASVPVLIESPAVAMQGLPCHADLLNISAGGCCLALDSGCRLQRGDRGTLHHELIPGVSQSRDFEVRWLEESGGICVVGVQFVRP